MTDDGAKANVQQRVTAWLNETGFPLEMRTARQFQQHDLMGIWEIWPNSTYTDSNTGSMREIDIDAYRFAEHNDPSEISIGFEVVCECKATANPWVVLVETFEENTRPLASSIGKWPLMHKVGGEPLKCNLTHINFMSYGAATLPVVNRPGYGAVEAFRKPGEKNSANDAIRQVIDALIGVQSKLAIPSLPTIVVMYYFPIIVTTSPLFEATLAADGRATVIRQVSRTSVLFDRSENQNVEVVLLNESEVPNLLNQIGGMPALAQTFLDSFDRSVFEKFRRDLKST